MRLPAFCSLKHIYIGHQKEGEAIPPTYHPFSQAPLLHNTSTPTCTTMRVSTAASALAATAWAVTALWPPGADGAPTAIGPTSADVNSTDVSCPPFTAPIWPKTLADDYMPTYAFAEADVATDLLLETFNSQLAQQNAVTRTPADQRSTSGRAWLRIPPPVTLQLLATQCPSWRKPQLRTVRSQAGSVVCRRLSGAVCVTRGND